MAYQVGLQVPEIGPPIALSAAPVELMGRTLGLALRLILALREE